MRFSRPLLATLLGFLAIPACCVLWIFWGILTFDRPYRSWVPNPGAEFTTETGMKWPRSAKVVLVGDDHGGIRGRGEFFLVFEVDSKGLEQLLERDPPWRGPVWQEGGVPKDIALHCQFGRNSDASEALLSPDVIYCAQAFEGRPHPWFIGRVLAVNCKTKRVYFSRWDW